MHLRFTARPTQRNPPDRSQIRPTRICVQRLQIQFDERIAVLQRQIVLCRLQPLALRTGIYRHPQRRHALALTMNNQPQRCHRQIQRHIQLHQQLLKPFLLAVLKLRWPRQIEILWQSVYVVRWITIEQHSYQLSIR